MKNQRTDHSLVRILELVIYVLIVVFSYYLAFLIRFNFNPIEYNLQPYVDSIFFILIFSLIVFIIYSLASSRPKPFFENLLIIIVSLLIINFLVIMFLFLNRGFAFPRTVLLLGFLIQLTSITFIRQLFNYIAFNQMTVKSVVIFSNKNDKSDFIDSLLFNKWNKIHLSKLIYSTNLKTLQLINSNDIVFISDSLSSNKRNDILKYCLDNSIFVFQMPNYVDLYVHSSKQIIYDDVLLLQNQNYSLSFEQDLLKRFFDIVVSLSAILLLSPLFLIISLLIKVSDGGSIIFKQERVTRNEKTFNVYKFRSMIENAEGKTGPVFAKSKDNRVTKVGAFLRKTRLDELPQLFNVLLGDMSIVGPRPERPVFVSDFKKTIPGYKHRFLVKAGITGLAQIYGSYSTLTENKLKFDLYYIWNYSIILDFTIILNTIITVLTKESAEGLNDTIDFDLILQKFNYDYKDHGDYLEFYQKTKEGHL